MNTTLRLANDHGRKLSKKITFGVAALEAIEPPVHNRVIVHDTRTPGLCLQITAANARTYYLYKKINGRPVRVRIAAYGEITVDNARKAAAALALQVANGVNPQLAKRTARDEMTFGELFTQYLELHAKVHKRTWKEDERQYKKHLAGWKTRTLAHIDTATVKGLHAKVGAVAPYAANRLLALLSSVFSFARSTLNMQKPNPCADVKRFKEQTRERFLDADELPRFFAAVEQEEDSTMRDFFQVTLFTGARRSNVQAMRWDQLDLNKGLWVLPGELMKNGKPITIHLSVPCLEILRQRHADAGNGPTSGLEWVFPSWGRTGHIVESKKAWAALLQRANLKDLRLHDLRRTLGSWQAATGASLPIIGKSLGHKTQQATAIYARLSLDPVKDAVDKATTAMLAAGKTAVEAQPEAVKTKRRKRKAQGEGK